MDAQTRRRERRAEKQAQWKAANPLLVGVSAKPVNWSDEEFIRQIKELIGNEGDIHVTCNHSEGEQVTETHVHAESSLVSP